MKSESQRLENPKLCACWLVHYISGKEEAEVGGFKQRERDLDLILRVQYCLRTDTQRKNSTDRVPKELQRHWYILDYKIFRRSQAKQMENKQRVWEMEHIKQHLRYASN